MDIKKKLVKSINENLNHKGLCLELKLDFNKKYFVLDKEIEADNVRASIQSGYLDSYMILHKFWKMLSEDKVDIVFNEKATKHDLDYLEKLDKDS